ncbi:hypothetical protein GCM10009422_29430 [Brevundimonas kwangchunensis]|uniref:Hemerythrin-like domain-containing protein n=1 Tax=Brevundimonas kwangchunensis TaxID=322163 RepID=A0ABP3S9Y1_9CAUL
MAQAYDDMDAIALLKADHRLIEDLFEQFEKASGKAEQKRLAEKLVLELKVHTVLEEEILYPACRGEIDDHKLDEGYVEHDATKVLMNDIEAGGPDEHFYATKVHVLSEMMEHHFEEEEAAKKGIFSLARHAGLDMKDLADQMRLRRETAMAEFKAHPGRPSETRTFVGDNVDSALVDEPFEEPPVRGGVEAR